MSRSDPTITVLCDRCEAYDEEVHLTPLAGGAYDERNVDGVLGRSGWTTDGEHDICPECTEEAAEGKEAQL